VKNLYSPINHYWYKTCVIIYVFDKCQKIEH